jgi:hypothetical protein
MPITAPGKIKKTTDAIGRQWAWRCPDSVFSHTWRHGKHEVGAGSTNGWRYQIHAGPCASDREYKTLREAMADCKDTEAAQ